MWRVPHFGRRWGGGRPRGNSGSRGGWGRCWTGLIGYTDIKLTYGADSIFDIRFLDHCSEEGEGWVVVIALPGRRGGRARCSMLSAFSTYGSDGERLRINVHRPSRAAFGHLILMQGVPIEFYTIVRGLVRCLKGSICVYVPTDLIFTARFARVVALTIAEPILVLDRMSTSSQIIQISIQKLATQAPEEIHLCSGC